MYVHVECSVGNLVYMNAYMMFCLHWYPCSTHVRSLKSEASTHREVHPRWVDAAQPRYGPGQEPQGRFNDSKQAEQGPDGFLCARCSTWGTHRYPGFSQAKLMSSLESVSNRGVDLSMTVSCLARFVIHQRPSVASSCKFTEYLKLIAQTCQTRFFLFLGYISWFEFWGLQLTKLRRHRESICRQTAFQTSRSCCGPDTWSGVDDHGWPLYKFIPSGKLT